jgi:arylsulfatase A-like enzyme
VQSARLHRGRRLSAATGSLGKKEKDMSLVRTLCLGLLALFVAVMATSVPATAQQPKPNILFIMGDDIGWMQPSIYHRGLMVGETPNIDRIGSEGAIFMTYYAEESCTAGRNSFFTGMHPLRTGMIPPQLPGSPSYLRPGTPALAWFLRDLGYNTGEFGKNHLGLVQVVRWDGGKPNMPGSGAADAGAVEDSGRGNLLPRHRLARP